MGRLSKVFAAGIVAAFLLSLAVVPAHAAAELDITKTADVETTRGCEVVMYTITITNNGDEDATDVVVTDVLDDRWVFIAESGTGFIASHTFETNGEVKLVWSSGTLSAGETETMKVSVASPFLTSDATIANEVTATANPGLTASASDSVDVEATPVNTQCGEIGGGTTPVFVPGTGGGLPTTGVNPLLLGALLLPVAFAVERWAWKKEHANA